MAGKKTSGQIVERERLGTPTDLKAEATRDISGGLAILLADVFALYLKTKNFHWHMSGPHFRDYHLMLDDQSDQIFAMTDPMAERARKIGGATLKSIGEISRKQRILDNDAAYVDPKRHARRAGRRQSPARRQHAGCARRHATNMATSPPPASSKCGSTRASGAPGSCSRRRAAAKAATTEGRAPFACLISNENGRHPGYGCRPFRLRR